MIYFVLNVIFAVFLIWLSFYVDKRTGSKTSNPLSNSILLLSGCAFVTAIVLLSAFYAPMRLSLFFFRVLVVMIGIFSIEICSYCILYPQIKKIKIVSFVKFVFFICFIWFAFTRINSVSITPFLGILVVSDAFFKGYLTNYFPYSWFDLYVTLVLYVFPATAVIVMLLRAENKNDKIDFQKAFIRAVGVIACWAAVFLLRIASKRVPLFMTLYLFAVVVMEILFVRSSLLNILYDFPAFFGGMLHFTFGLLIPSLFTGLAFSFFWQIHDQNMPLFITIVIFVIFIALAFSYQMEKLFTKLSRFRSIKYATQFEEDLAGLDYNNEPSQILNEMRDIFAKNIGATSVKILIDNGTDRLESIFDSDTNKKIVLDIKNKTFDYLLNINKTILFRSSAESENSADIDRSELEQLFKKTQSDAIIILNEGRHILGILVLGSKASGNVYDDYDYAVFTKLYSYFFVFGYYMKNIANQSVVGTVNREIRMSSQIIASIQENMDRIKNPSIDSGSIMVPSHNIGGEFIDLIRLTDTKHVFVLGDLSGKGISASMSMVIVKSIIRTFLAETSDFKLLVQKVNAFIRFNLPKGTFFEGVFGLLDFTDNTMYYINCGVPAMFLYTRTYNNVIEIQGTGHVLGFVKDISPLIKVKKVKLNPGDIVLTCTDGLIDAYSLRGEQFGKERIQKAITENSMYPALKMAQFTYDSLIKFVSRGLEDDVSILVIKCLAK